MSLMIDTKQLEGMENIRALAKATNHWGFVKTPYGKMYLGGKDDGIAMRYFHGYLYEPVSMELWTRACAGAKMAVDVGAHTGIYTLAAYKAKAQRIISLEPYFLNAARLILNLHANQMPMHDVVVAAASDHDDVGELCVARTQYAQYYCTTGSSLTHPTNVYDRYTVRLCRLDALIRDRVDVLKIDAEYHTAAILDGARELLKSQPDLILECFESDLMERLTAAGYRFWLIDERDGLHPTETIEAQEMDQFRRNYYASVREAPQDLLA